MMERKNKRFLVIGTGILILLLGIALLVGFASRERHPSEPKGDDDNDFPWFIFIPIWAAVFIPMLANKKQRDDLAEQGRMRIILAAMVGLLVAGVLVMLLLL